MAEVAQRRVGRAHAGDGEIAFELIVFRALRLRLVAEGIAKDLLQETGVQGGFLLVQMPIGFEVVPLAQNLFGTVLFFSTEIGGVGVRARKRGKNKVRWRRFSSLANRSGPHIWYRAEDEAFLLMRSRPAPARGTIMSPILGG